jgi:hypothetical protein
MRIPERRATGGLALHPLAVMNSGSRVGALLTAEKGINPNGASISTLRFQALSI